MDCQEIRGDLRAAAASYSAQRQQSAQLLLCPEAHPALFESGGV